MKQTIFISKNLNPNSIFKQALEDENFTVFHHSLINFSPIPFHYNFQTDWFFFYSKNAVRFFFQKYCQENIGKVKLASIGIATANSLIERGISVNFIGSGDPQETAKAFLKVAQDQRVLFPRAINSKMSIQKILEGKIEAIDLVVYRNEPKENVDIPKTDFVVLTSPLNTKVYFKQRKHSDNQHYIAIGKTTGKALEKLGILDFIIAKNPTEEALMKAVLSLDKESQ